MTTSTTIPADNINAFPLDFCLRLARAHAVMIRRFDNTLGNLHGISFSDFQLLHHLHHAPGGRLRRVDLAERLGLTASGVTRSLLPLEKIGLIARQPDPRDARVGYAVVTPAGQEILAHALNTAHMISQELLKDSTNARLEAFSTLLAQMAGLNLSNS
jgi:DNA-binding MarR family transcriptional regulator